MTTVHVTNGNGEQIVGILQENSREKRLVLIVHGEQGTHINSILELRVIYFYKDIKTIYIKKAWPNSYHTILFVLTFVVTETVMVNLVMTI